VGDHTETVQLEFDPLIVTYKQLLEFFWECHNPTSRSSRQYMSAIFYHSLEQKKLAEASRNEEQKKHSSSITTVIEPAGDFYLAEDYHQKWELRQNRNLMKHFKKLSIAEFIASPLATRLNAFVAGYCKKEDIPKEFQDSVSEFASHCRKH